MADLITDFIDEKAFAQFERLKSALKSSQAEFAEVIKAAAALNAELTKSKGMDELISNMDNLAKSSKKIVDAEKEQIKTHEELKKAEDELLAGIKARLESSNASEPVTKKMNASLEEQIRVQVRLKAEIKGLRDEQRKLDKGLKDGVISGEKAAQAATKLATEENLLKQQLTTTNLEIRRSIKEQQAAQGSSDQLASQLDILRANYRALSEEERSNVEVGGKMLTQIQELDTELKELDKSQGVHNREVGNYKLATEGLQGAFSSLFPQVNQLTAAYEKGAGVLSGLANTVKEYVNGTMAQTAAQETNTSATIAGATATKASAIATGGASKALKIFRVALMSTGIGAIVVLLGSLVSYLTGTQEGVDMVTKVTRPLQAIFSQLVGVLQKLGEGLVAAFSNPRKAIEDLYNWIKDKIIKQFQGLYDIVVGIATLDFDQAKNGLKLMTEDAVNAAKSVGQFFDEAAKKGAEIDRIAKDIQKSELELTKTQAQLNRLIQEEREKSRDAALSAEERAEAGQKALAAVNELAEKQTSLQDKRIAKLKLEQSLSGNLHADNIELAEMQAERDNIAASAAQQRLRIQSSVNSALKEAEKKANDEYIARVKERTEIEEAANKRIAELTNLKFEQEIKANKKAADSYKQIAADETKGFEDRLENLALYAFKQEEAIESNLANEQAKIREGLKEVADLEKAGRAKEAAAVREMVELQLNESFEKERELKIALAEEVSKSQLGIIKSSLTQEQKERISMIQETNQNEMIEIERAFAEGRISNEQYQLDKYNTQKAYNDAILAYEIETIEKIIETQKAKGVNVASEEEKLAKLKMQQSKLAAEAEIKDLNRVKEEHAKVAAVRKEITKELTALTIDLGHDIFERENQRLEAKIEDLDRETELKKLAIEQEVLGEEDRRIKLAEIDEQAAVERMKLEDEQRKNKIRQAKFDRAVGIMEIIINTARGVTAALPIIPLSIAVGVLGAVQLASVLSQPLPKYYTGTDSSVEGFAKVGERGEELYITPQGEVGLTPNKETLTYLQGGTKIIDAEKTKDILRNSSSIDLPPLQNNMIDIKQLIKSGKKNTDDLKKAIASRPEHSTTLTRRGLRNTYKNGANWYNYKSNLLN